MLGGGGQDLVYVFMLHAHYAIGHVHWHTEVRLLIIIAAICACNIAFQNTLSACFSSSSNIHSVVIAPMDLMGGGGGGGGGEGG